MTVGLMSLRCGANIYADGSSAPAGGAAQHPTYLNGYAARPPWNVAGIDYAVGPHSGTSFTSVVASPPAGTSYASNVLTVNSDNVTIDGYDFSVSTGVQLVCTHNNLIVRNCKWGGATLATVSTGVIDFRGANLTVEYCTIDGGSDGGPSDTQACLVYVGVGSSGNITFRYNWCKNYCAQIMELLRGVTLDYEFNLLDDALIATNDHMNTLQFDTGTGTFSVTVKFNTLYQSLVPGTAAGEGFQFYSSTAITLASPTFANNTLIAKTTGCMSNMVHGSADSGTTTLTGTATNASNYFDTTGATGAAYYPGSMTTGWTSSGNKKMTDGTTITPA